MKFRIILILITILLVSQVNIFAESGYCGDRKISNDNIKWSLNNEGLLVIEGEGFMKTYFKYKDVPWYSLRDKIKEVHIGEGVRSISLWAFRECFNLEKVTLSKDLEIIGGGAFYGCEKLTEIILGENIIDIGSYAFYGCKSLNTIVNESPKTSIVYDNTFDTKAETRLISKGISTNTNFIRSTTNNKYSFIEIY